MQVAPGGPYLDFDWGWDPEVQAPLHTGLDYLGNLDDIFRADIKYEFVVQL